MAVIFDEVVGTVEPESGPAAGPAQPAGEAGQGGRPDPFEQRRAERRMARRDARLHAD